MTALSLPAAAAALGRALDREAHNPDAGPYWHRLDLRILISAHQILAGQKALNRWVTLDFLAVEIGGSMSLDQRDAWCEQHQRTLRGGAGLPRGSPLRPVACALRRRQARRAGSRQLGSHRPGLAENDARSQISLASDTTFGHNKDVSSIDTFSGIDIDTARTDIEVREDVRTGGTTVTGTFTFDGTTCKVVLEALENVYIEVREGSTRVRTWCAGWADAGESVAEAVTDHKRFHTLDAWTADRLRFMGHQAVRFINPHYGRASLAF